MKPKLKIGSIIQIVGFVMLKGLDDGHKYRVQSMPDFYNTPTYQLTKAKGKKITCRHTTYDVDGMINPNNLNRIEIVKL